MRLLLDTQIVLWQLAGDWEPAPTARSAIEDADELRVSVVSFAEIGVKMAIGKLQAPQTLYEHIIDSGIRVLGLSPEHGLGVARLPVHHRDPFDRLIISQARAEKLSVLTADRRFADYDVEVVRAWR